MKNVILNAIIPERIGGYETNRTPPDAPPGSSAAQSRRPRKNRAVLTDSSGDYEYILLEDGSAEIAGYSGSAEDLEVPAELDGHPVTSIGDGAFYYCDSLTSVTIPDGVTSIGEGAFAFAKVWPASLSPIASPPSAPIPLSDATSFKPFRFHMTILFLRPLTAYCLKKLKKSWSVTQPVWQR